MHALLAYFAAILDDGDWANDWLTHLPAIVRPFVLALGQIIAAVVGN